MRWMMALIMALLMACGVAGCTAESTHLAIQTQRRVDDVQQEIFGRQHDGLRVLLFRDAVHRMNAVGEPLNETQMDVLNTVWNERDLIETWSVQNERAMGLRRVGVDLKLYGSQSMVDLLGKQILAKGRRAEAAFARAAGAGATSGAGRFSAPPASTPGPAASQPADGRQPPDHQAEETQPDPGPEEATDGATGDT